MWNPFRYRKIRAPNADLPRSPEGKFMPRTPQPTIDIAVEKETKAVTNVLDLLSAVRKMAADENTLIEQKVQAALEGYEGEEPDGNQWLPVIQQVAQYVGPYLPALLERFGIKPAEVSPTSSPPAESPSPSPSDDLLVWINRAAEASPKLIKPFIPKLLEEVEKRGIPQDKFKQAIQNISKAI